jgi:hypothetical protein
MPNPQPPALDTPPTGIVAPAAVPTGSAPTGSAPTVPVPSGPAPADAGPTASASERQLRRLARSSSRPWRPLVAWSGATAAVGLASIGLYSSDQPQWRQSASAALLVAIAAAGAGALLGLLFAVPHPAWDGPSTDPAATHRPTRSQLEQISDWLTKILIGVALTQAPGIAGDAGGLFGWLGPMLGTGGTAVVYAGGLVIFATVTGFMIGWIFGRFLLDRDAPRTRRPAASVALIEAAAVAQRNGDAVTAAALRGRAIDLSGGAPGARAELEVMRPGLTSQPTERLEQIMVEARRTARALRLDPEDVAAMLRDHAEGQRATALAFMQAKQELTDIDAVAAVLAAPRSIFEQHQALRLAVQVLPYLSLPDADRLRSAARRSSLDLSCDPASTTLRSELLGLRPRHRAGRGPTSTC